MYIKNFIKNKNSTLFFLVLIIFVVVVFLFLNKKENFGDCGDSSTVNDMPKGAAEACKRISTEAEKIKAHYGGAKGVLEEITGILTFGLSKAVNPKNYAAGDNESDNTVRNIINTNLSSCEITKIENTCKNSSATYQENKIDMTKCDYCQKNGCTVKGVRQKNKSKVEQVCTMRLLISALTEKTDSVKAQALAKVAQETEGLLSGNNNTRTENCNIIDKDMSSKKYLEQKSECLNELATTQINEFVGCGDLIDVIQENESEQIQKCLLNSDVKSKDKKTSSTDLKAIFDISQFSKGIDTAALSISSLVSSLSIVSVLGIGFLVMQEEV